MVRLVVREMSTTINLILLLGAGMMSSSTANISSQVDHINNCCDLGYGHFTFSRKIKQSRIYVLPNICGDDHLEVEAYCDTINGGGGWLVVQRRQDGSVDFNRTWVDYEDGFGELTGEFWYGLRALHCLTGQGGWEMRMDIKLFNGTNVFLHYEEFMVSSAIDKYKLTVGGFQGTTTNPMAIRHYGMSFTTKDSDNDQYAERNCALHHGLSKPVGGWWYKDCWHIAPNLHYEDRASAMYINSQWLKFESMEIKIRPFQCNI